MLEMIYRKIADGIYFRGEKKAHFKTMRLSVHFIVPILKETAAANALLPYMLIRSSKSYPDYTCLARHLSDLYGASLYAHAERHGKNQILSVSVSGLSNRYALFGENLLEEFSKLLYEVVFDPHFGEDGEFDENGFEIEKRQTLELIDSEMNDKRLYARNGCLRAMLRDELSCVSRFGSREDVEKLNRTDLKAAWKRILREARIEIMAFGDCDPENILNLFVRLSQIHSDRMVSDFDLSICSAQVQRVQECRESLDVVQSKLVMGFKTNIPPEDERIYALRVAVALFGGTPNSKLFVNVREKLSLCYYCSASIDRALGIMLVDSGIDPQNYEAARKEILHQLKQVQDGNFTDWELNAAKLSLCDSYKTVSDYISGMENWYLYRTFLSNVKTPEEVSAEIMTVDRQRVLEAISSIVLDTVFLLEGAKRLED